MNPLPSAFLLLGFTLIAFPSVAQVRGGGVAGGTRAAPPVQLPQVAADMNAQIAILNSAGSPQLMAQALSGTLAAPDATPTQRVAAELLVHAIAQPTALTATQGLLSTIGVEGRATAEEVGRKLEVLAKPFHGDPEAARAFEGVLSRMSALGAPTSSVDELKSRMDSFFAGAGKGMSPDSAPGVAADTAPLWRRLLPRGWTLQRAEPRGPRAATTEVPSPSTAKINAVRLLKEAVGDEEFKKDRILAENLGAAFGLKVRAENDKSYHAYKLSGSGVPNFGHNDYYPDEAGYLMSPEVLQLADLVISGRVPSRDFKWAQPVFDALLTYAKRAPANQAELTARIDELKARGQITIDGKQYIPIGAQAGRKEVPVRLAQPSDWSVAPPIRANGLTGQEILDTPEPKKVFGDILSRPYRYTGHGTISSSRELPVVEGSEVFVLTSPGAVRGRYRGSWSTGARRGSPLDERLRSGKLSEAARIHFVEVSSEGKAPEIIAVDGNDPAIRIFSTARSER